VRGKIVLCDYDDIYTYPAKVGFASGAAGLIFRTTSPLAVPDLYALPAIQISASDGNSVFSYLNSTRYTTFLQSIKHHT